MTFNELELQHFVRVAKHYGLPVPSEVTEYLAQKDRAILKNRALQKQGGVVNGRLLSPKRVQALDLLLDLPKELQELAKERNPRLF